MKFDFKLKPGQNLEKSKYINTAKTISVIMPVLQNYSNIKNAIYSVLNQTFPDFELILVKNNKVSNDIENQIKELKDERVRVINTDENDILEMRNLGASQSESGYIVFLENDNLLERTFLETLYITLETHKTASLAYTNYIVYGDNNRLVNEWLLKDSTNINILSMIRKKDFDETSGFEKCEKIESEKKLLKKLQSEGKIFIHTASYLSWIAESNFEQKETNKNKIRDIQINYEDYQKEKVAIQFPRFKYDYENIYDNLDVHIPKKIIDNKINILMIVPWMITGGADIFNLELIKRLDKSRYSFTILSTEPYIDNLKQQFDRYADVYELPLFLDQKDWIGFINYLMQKNNINVIFNTSSLYGYSILSYLKGMYPNIPIIDYVHMEEWYNRNGGYARSSSQFSSVIDKTLVCNAVTEKVMKDYFKRKENEVNTLYIGVDTDKFDPDKYDKQELLKKYNLENNDKFIVSYICRISEQKRPMLLVEIIKKTLEKRKDILFLIVGDGPMLNRLKNSLKIYKDNVKFLPSTNLTPEMYKISDATINCSIKEGLALTAYESLSMGVPVISADVGGQRELVNDNVGKLVPCYQNEKEIYNFIYKDEEIDNYVTAIDYVVKEHDELAKNCRKEILDKFTLVQMAENMDKEFKNVKENPKEDKINNGKSLKNNIDITKELIIASLMEDKPKTEYQCGEFWKNVYKIVVIFNSIQFSRKEKMKMFLWRNPLWRKFTQTKLWNVAKRLLRRG